MKIMKVNKQMFAVFIIPILLSFLIECLLMCIGAVFIWCGTQVHELTEWLVAFVSHPITQEEFDEETKEAPPD